MGDGLTESGLGRKPSNSAEFTHECALALARHVARELRYPQSTLVKILELLELPEQIQQAVERGELPVTTAYELRKVEDAGEQVAIAERIAAENLMREQAGEIIRRRAGAKARKETSRTIRATVGSRVIVENRRGLDAEMILAMLRDALAQVEAEQTRGGGLTSSATEVATTKGGRDGEEAAEVDVRGEGPGPRPAAARSPGGVAPRPGGRALRVRQNYLRRAGPGPIWLERA